MIADVTLLKPELKTSEWILGTNVKQSGDLIIKITSSLLYASIALWSKMFINVFWITCKKVHRRWMNQHHTDHKHVSKMVANRIQLRKLMFCTSRFSHVIRILLNLLRNKTHWKKSPGIVVLFKVKSP